MITIWKSFINRFFHTKFRQNVLVLTSGNLTVQAIALISYPVLTRLYPDEVFGQYALFNGVVLLLTFAIALRYEAAIPLPASDHEAGILKKSTVLIALLFSVIVSFLAFLADWINIYPPLKGVFPLVPLVVLASGLLQIYRFWHLRINRLVSYFTILIGYRTIYTMIAVVLPYTIITTENGLVTAISIASAVVLIAIMAKNRDDFKPDLEWGKALSILKEHYRFPKYAMPSMILGHVTNQIPIFLLAYYFGEGMTGQYSVAYALLFLPQNMLMGRISEALYQNFRSVQISQLKFVVFKIWRRVALILLGPCIILFLFGSQIFEFILGNQWTLAGRISEYLSLAIFFSSVFASTSSVMLILNLQKIGFSLSLFRMGYILIAFVLSGLLDDLFIGIKIMVFMIAITQLGIIVFLYKKLGSA